MASVQDLIARVLRAVGEEELRRVRGAIGSSTLRRALELIVEENLYRARLFIPHYWAVYYHDGAAPFGPLTASVLVFFDDPRDDPRIASGYPVRASEIRRLTREEYENGLEINRERMANGDRPFMFVVKNVGPHAAHPFFDELGVGAAERAGPVVMETFDQWIQEQLDTDPALRPEKGGATFGI